MVTPYHFSVISDILRIPCNLVLPQSFEHKQTNFEVCFFSSYQVFKSPRPTGLWRMTTLISLLGSQNLKYLSMSHFQGTPMLFSSLASTDSLTEKVNGNDDETVSLFIYIVKVFRQILRIAVVKYFLAY